MVCILSPGEWGCVDIDSVMRIIVQDLGPVTASAVPKCFMHTCMRAFRIANKAVRIVIICFIYALRSKLPGMCNRK